MDDLQTVATWLLSSLLGGGVVATAGYAVLRDKIQKDFQEIFAKRSEVLQARTELQNDINRVGSKVTGAVSVASMAKDTADANSDAIIRLQEAEKHIAVSLDRMNERLDKADQRGEKHTAMLDEITRRLDRNEERRNGL